MIVIIFSSIVIIFSLMTGLNISNKKGNDCKNIGHLQCWPFAIDYYWMNAVDLDKSW